MMGLCMTGEIYTNDRDRTGITKITKQSKGGKKYDFGQQLSIKNIEKGKFMMKNPPFLDWRGGGGGCIRDT